MSVEETRVPTGPDSSPTPGTVVRQAPPTDWAAVLAGSVRRHRAHRDHHRGSPQSVSRRDAAAHEAAQRVGSQQRAKQQQRLHADDRRKQQQLQNAGHDRRSALLAHRAADAAPGQQALHVGHSAPSVASSRDAHASPSTSASASASAVTTHVASTSSSALSSALSSSSSLPAVSPRDKLAHLLAQPSFGLDALKRLAWSGVPPLRRPIVWKLLLGYAPTTATRRRDTLCRKRRDYREAVAQHYGHDAVVLDAARRGNGGSSACSQADGDHDGGSGGGGSDSAPPEIHARPTSQEDVTMRQISVDIPRTCPGHSLFQLHQVQQALKRVLYVWATRHPASGYVQGMNDLATPFLFVFLSEHARTSLPPGQVLRARDLAVFVDADRAVADAEADAYWCLTALLNDIQDYYTFSQPGIQRRVHFLRDLVSRVDSALCTHLDEQGLDFMHFSFRWMNCLLMRELPFPIIVRVWDTYLAEDEGFAVFHVYVCAALLVSFSPTLMEMEFQDLVMFLQNLPTQRWTDKDIDVILSQAYMWRAIFGAAPSLK